MAIAKLPARSQVARMVKVINVDDDIVGERCYQAVLMCDGAILEKVDAVLKSDGKRHSEGWTFTLEEVTPDTFTAFFAAKGYTNVSFQNPAERVEEA